MSTNASEVLRRVAIFSGLTPPEIESLASRAVFRKFPSGGQLFAEGDPCEGLFVVVSGLARVFKMSPGGREQVLTLDGPGSSVAEVPVFDGGPFPASCVAVGDSEMLFLSRRALHDVCLERPEVALKVLAMVGRRLRHLVGMIEELSFTTVRARLIAHLLREAKANGTRGDGGLAFTLAATHQEIAAQIGTVRELVSRNVSRLQAEGLIESNGRGGIVIRDLERFEAELSGN